MATFCSLGRWKLGGNLESICSLDCASLEFFGIVVLDEFFESGHGDCLVGMESSTD